MGFIYGVIPDNEASDGDDCEETGGATPENKAACKAADKASPQSNKAD
jgi:hypothetical protein